MEQTRNQTVYWTQLIHDQWKMYMAATAKGLVFVGSQEGSFEELEKWVVKRLPKHTLQQNDLIMVDFTTQFREYFLGGRTEFTLQVDLLGTDFQQAVWKELAAIPHGDTHSYSTIADRINKPQAVRAVGTAIGANPLLIVIPCHRVIGKNGSLTGFRGGLEMKAGLLRLEKGG